MIAAPIYFWSRGKAWKPEAPSGADNVHFYYGGITYFHRGYHVHELPDDVEYLGEVNNVGNIYTDVEFDGNVDGYIYVPKTDNSVVYFQ